MTSTVVPTGQFAYDPDTGVSTTPPFVALIRTANGIIPGLFGKPITLGPIAGGGSFEEYAEAIVAHYPDGTTAFTARSDRARNAIERAAELIAHKES